MRGSHLPFPRPRHGGADADSSDRFILLLIEERAANRYGGAEGRPYVRNANTTLPATSAAPARKVWPSGPDQLRAVHGHLAVRRLPNRPVSPDGPTYLARACDLFALALVRWA